MLVRDHHSKPGARARTPASSRSAAVLVSRRAYVRRRCRVAGASTASSSVERTPSTRPPRPREGATDAEVTHIHIGEPVALPCGRIDGGVGLLEHPITIVVLEEDVGFQQVFIEGVGIGPNATETFDPLAASHVDVLAEQVLG